MTIDERKHELRSRLRELRSGLGEGLRSELDAAIEQQVLSLAEYAAADLLLTYLDVGSEVRTRGIIQAAWDAGKQVALPRCVPGTRQMRWLCVSSLDGLERSPLGVEEPLASSDAELAVDAMQGALALVPGLAFDLQGFRLGYGGGFYDTFLAGFSGVSVGLCREPQLLDSLSKLGVIDTHDRHVQLVVTDSRIIN